MKCDNCRANKICDHNTWGFETCNNFIPLCSTELEQLKAEKDNLIKTYKECALEVTKWFAHELLNRTKYIHCGDLDLEFEVCSLLKELEGNKVERN
jgi:hypothetical protein